MKRLFDIVVSIILLMVLSPFIVAIFIMLKISGGTAFFIQERVGYQRGIFKIIKFRTMIENADNYIDARGNPTRVRITRVGKFLRKTSLDEIPQLINIIRGEMSFIGPRPILPTMLPYLTASERRRFDVRPGITGLAQVKGRNHLRWSRRFRYDLIYIKNISLYLDIKIIISTILVVYNTDNISMDRNPSEVDDVTIRKIS